MKKIFISLLLLFSVALISAQKTEYTTVTNIPYYNEATTNSDSKKAAAPRSAPWPSISKRCGATRSGN